jgi:hypothetical protein
MPPNLRTEATAAVRELVADGGTLLVIAAATDTAATMADEGPPWPLTRDEIDAFGAEGLRPARIERLASPTRPAGRWRAEFRRD